MKIALLHDSLLPPKTYGGIERIVMALLKEYIRLGHRVVLLSRQGTEVDGCECIGLSTGAKGLEIKEKIPSDVDFLHAHQPLDFRPEIPFLVTIHGNGSPEEKYFSNTNFLSQSHARNHGAKYQIYNGIDVCNYPFVEKKQDYFVFLAKASWRVKNLKTAIDWATDLGVRLEVAGGSGIDRKNIKYHGMIGGKEKMDLLANAKALIYPTNWDEPCAVALLEALACGTPVIGSVNGCMTEIVTPKVGVTCNTYNELLEAPKKLNALSTYECRKVAEEMFSVERMATEYIDLMKKIISDGDLDHQPKYNFSPSSVKYIYKPTIKNKFQHAIMGRI